ncbi:hypothetical protein BH23ACT9_BH23ACT9_10630 [soil metagenome]
MVLLLLCLVCLAASTAPATDAPAAPAGDSPVLLIIDASGSMNADDGTGRPKIEAAREALHALIDGLGTESNVGLRAFGHRTPNTDRDAGCADTELLVPVARGNSDALRTAVDGLSASGFTPIGASLLEALGDLPEAAERTIILVSDGLDTCAPPAACDVARDIVAQGVQLRVETVGFQVDAAAEAELRCIAEVTGGTYRPVDGAEDLARELRANIPSGTPVEGGRSPATATPVVPGQYVDALVFPEQRWYAVTLEGGDRVRSTAAIIGQFDTPSVPDASVTMTLGFLDVIGTAPCDTDAVQGIGPFTQNLAVDGLEVAGGTVCGDPGTYVIGLSLEPADDIDGERALRGVAVPIELFVAVTSNVVAVEAEPAVDRPRPAAPPPVDPGRLPTPTAYYLLAVGGFGVLGTLLGAVASRRMGP